MVYIVPVVHTYNIMVHSMLRPCGGTFWFSLFPRHQCSFSELGDARKNYRTVRKTNTAAAAGGGGATQHCHGNAAREGTNSRGPREAGGRRKQQQTAANRSSDQTPYAVNLLRSPPGADTFYVRPTYIRLSQDGYHTYHNQRTGNKKRNKGDMMYI